MACGCTPSLVIPSNPCKDCLQVNSLIYGCDDAPSPCGDSFTVDLTVYNDVTACTECTPVYSLVSAESPGVTATLTSGGSLVVTTSNYYVQGKLWEIIYKVDCPCSILSATAKVSVCMDNPCDTECRGNCNPCSGNCMIVPDITVPPEDSEGPCGESVAVDVATACTLTECNSGVVTYEVDSYSSAFTSAVISSLGVLTVVTSDTAVQGNSYDVIVKVKCDAYGIYELTTVTIGIKDLCDGVVCAEGQICEACTGNCIAEREIDLSISI